MDQKVKQRLVGSIVLFVIAAILMLIVLPKNNLSASHHQFVSPVMLTSSAKPRIEMVVKRRSNEIHQRQLKAAPHLSNKLAKPVADVKAYTKSEPTISKPLDNQITHWIVQLASFQKASNAHLLQKKLQKSHIQALVNFVPGEHKTGYYRVIIGYFSSRQEAEKNKQALISMVKLTGMVRSISQKKQ